MATELDLPDLLVSIRDCWCNVLVESLGGPPAACCIIAGEPVVAECCQGFAWVRLINSYPTHEFPAQDTEPHRCPLNIWASVIEIGISRCAPQPCDILDNSCCEAEMDASLILLDDFARMRNILACCIGTAPDSIVPGQWQVVGPQGGCITSSIRATFRWTG